jgi:hypothetical protein
LIGSFFFCHIICLDIEAREAYALLAGYNYKIARDILDCDEPAMYLNHSVFGSVKIALHLGEIRNKFIHPEAGRLVKCSFMMPRL